MTIETRNLCLGLLFVLAVALACATAASAQTVPTTDGRLSITPETGALCTAAMIEAPALRDSAGSHAERLERLRLDLEAAAAYADSSRAAAEAECAAVRASRASLLSALDVARRDRDAWEATAHSEARQKRVWRAVALPGIGGLLIAGTVGALLF